MQKVILVVLVVALLAVAGQKGWQRYHPAPVVPAHAATAPTKKSAAPPAAAATTEQQKQVAAVHAERQAVESALGSMKVSSLMLGDGAVCIINKNDYSLGDTLPLPGGRKLLVAAIREDGIGLTCNGQAYHLDAPAAPDLAALRKPR